MTLLLLLSPVSAAAVSPTVDVSAAVLSGGGVAGDVSWLFCVSAAAVVRLSLSGGTSTQSCLWKCTRLLLVFGSIALLAGTLGQWVSGSSKTQKTLNRIAGVVFLGLAIKLATAER